MIQACIHVQVILSTPLLRQLSSSQASWSLYLRVSQQPTMQETDSVSDDCSIDSESQLTEERVHHGQLGHVRRLRSLRGLTLGRKRLKPRELLRKRNVSWWTKILMSLTVCAALLVNPVLRVVSPFTELMPSLASGSYSSISSSHAYVQPCHSSIMVFKRSPRAGLNPIHPTRALQIGQITLAVVSNRSPSILITTTRAVFPFSML